MKQTKVNPLRVFDVRRVEFCPPYFETTVFPLRYNVKEAISEWIEDNLSGRYYVGKTVTGHKTINSNVKIGFENNSELSYFLLACPHLKYNQ